MKANAPEKLYIALNELTEDGRTFVLDHHVDYPICTEYTRTDAFIEKAEEYLKDQFIKDVSVLAGGVAHINFSAAIKNFVNYMKGE